MTEHNREEIAKNAGNQKVEDLDENPVFCSFVPTILPIPDHQRNS
jgi:hypothetical protein